LVFLVLFTACDDIPISCKPALFRGTWDDSVTNYASTVALGKVFFGDPRFSRDGRVACATCHRPDLAYADTLVYSKGVWGRLTQRNTPTLIGLPKDIPLMWDGGVTPLRYGSQAVLAAVTAHSDQDMNPLDLERKLTFYPLYKTALHQLYPHQTLAAGYLLSIHEYVKRISSIEPRGNHHKRFQMGEKDQTFRDSIARGQALFEGKAGCYRCHSGDARTDGRFYNLGLDSVDPGRAAISLLEADRGRFRTPPLRMLRFTAPYFHNGSAADLETVLRHYINGAGEAGRIDLSPQEQSQLLIYLKTL
jgi:cytochrome c peroxidase